MNTEKAQSIIESLNRDKTREYLAYWESIRPKNDFQYFSRFIFAICSIQTGWKINRDTYKRVMKLDWLHDKEMLRDIYKHSGAGLIHLRTDATWKLANAFLSNPKQFHKKDGETWTQFRNRLVKNVWGIGIAKISFALEMAFPNEAEVTCLDRHGFRLYEVKNASKGNYEKVESHWIETCKKVGVSPAMARHIYWDSIQKKENTRYWSDCLESNTGIFNWMLAKAELSIHRILTKI